MITDRLTARDVTADDVRELINTRQRELNNLEYKVSADADLLKAACGIANTGGGFILVGVDEDDDHRASAIVHVDRANSVADSVRQRLRDGLAPRPVIEVLPLTVDDRDIVITRISPQSPPHMVSHEKRTDFYGRYDATTERMRYEEINERFREKHDAGVVEAAAVPRTEIETIGGRSPLSLGAKGALDNHITRLRAIRTATFALIAIADSATDAIVESDAVTVLSEPLYARTGGWQVAHEKYDVKREDGDWVQSSGDLGAASINPSGDVLFLKDIDLIMCWQQPEIEFRIAPRLYPNALAEYCLSFAYLLTDIAARTKPKQFVIEIAFVNARGLTLPLGEGGSIWFDAPTDLPGQLKDEFVKSLPIPVSVSVGKPLSARHLAFVIAAQIYSLFGYLERQVAFAADEEIILEADPDSATLTSIRSYLQGMLGTVTSRPQQEFETGTNWFAFTIGGRRRRIGFSEDFVSDHHWPEHRLFDLLDGFDLQRLVQTHAESKQFLVTNNGVSL